MSKKQRCNRQKTTFSTTICHVSRSLRYLPTKSEICTKIYGNLRRLIGKCDVSDRNSWIPNWPIRSQSGHFKCCRPPRVSHFTNNSSNTEDLHSREILVFNRFGARFSFYQTLLKFCTLRYCANMMAAVGRLGNVSVFENLNFQNVVALRMLMYFMLCSNSLK